MDLIETRLTRYQIINSIGVGGMGEVYRATDTKLGREVAIKVLPAAFAQDPERLGRLEREARLLAALNHPAIAHVYAFETGALPDGPTVHFLVMELVEGEDLAERLKRGPIPFEEAVAISLQIVDGLEEAHDKGIVHRDLKPANIKVTSSGKVKVLDFGLAKALSGNGAGSTSADDLSQFPTIAHNGTAAGTILGTAASRGEQIHVQPAWLPGERGILYVANVIGGRQDVMVASGDGGTGRLLVEGGNSPRYAETGHLLFARAKTLLAAPFELRSLELTGEPFPVVEELDVAVYGNYRTARFSLSPNGTLAYLVDRPVARSGHLVFVDRRGNATAAFEEPGSYLVPRLSPDGSRVAYAAVDGQSGQRDVRIGDLRRGTRTRLTLARGASTDPVWTSDGQAVNYASTGDHGSLAIFTMPADGAREATQLTFGADPDRFLFPRAWLRDGSALVFHAIKSSDDIGIFGVGSTTEEMLLDGPFAELQPSLSPYGRFMAYVSDESGRRAVYVRPLAASAGRVQVSSGGGDEPVWSPRGDEIFYRQGPRMIAVPVSTASGVALGTPANLFEGSYDVDPFNNDATNCDVTPDGQRFLMVRSTGEGTVLQQLNVVVNWHEELLRLRGGRE